MPNDTEILNYLDGLLKGNRIYGETDVVLRGDPHTGVRFVKLGHGVLNLPELEKTGSHQDIRAAIRSLME